MKKILSEDSLKKLSKIIRTNISNLETSINSKADIATTLSGYGITDASIDTSNKTITLGEDTISVGSAVTVDSVLNAASINPVQNNVITNHFNNYAKKTDLNGYATTDSISGMITSTSLKEYVYSDSNNKTITVDGVTISSGGGGSITIDDAMSATSENPVQNKVITNYFGNYAKTSDLQGYATTDSISGMVTSSVMESYANIQDKTINIGDKSITVSEGEGITVDEAMSTISTNPVQNKVITNYFDNYAKASDLQGYATTDSIKGFITTAALQGYATTDSISGMITSASLEEYAYSNSTNNTITVDGVTVGNGGSGTGAVTTQVDSLPTATKNTENLIYMTPATTTATNYLMDKYVTVEHEGASTTATLYEDTELTHTYCTGVTYTLPKNISEYGNVILKFGNAANNDLWTREYDLTQLTSPFTVTNSDQTADQGTVEFSDNTITITAHTWGDHDIFIYSIVTDVPGETEYSWDKLANASGGGGGESKVVDTLVVDSANKKMTVTYEDATTASYAITYDSDGNITKIDKE